MNKKIIILMVILILFIPFVIIIFNNFKEQTKSVANINGISVSNQELQDQINRLNTFYTFSKQTDKNKALIKQDALNRLVEEKIIQNYANEKNINVSDEEALQKYKLIISTKSEDALLAQLKQMYGINKNDYLKVIKNDILREKVQKVIGKPLAQWILEEVKKSNIKK